MTTASDYNSSSTYAYDHIGRLTGDTKSFGDFGVMVGLAQTFDVNGNRLSLAATVGGTADLKDTFTYDDLNRMLTQTQQNQSGGHAVSSEAVAYQYTDAGRTSEVDRFSNVARTSLVAVTSIGYDDAGRMNSSSTGSTITLPFVSIGLMLDADGRVTSQTTLADGTRNFVYDSLGQVKTVTPTTGSAFVAEAYNYDAAGNRTSATDAASSVGTITTGTGDRVSNDSSHSYGYDLDGDRLTRNNAAGTTDRYTYDAVDRLAKVQTQNGSGTITQTSTYTYDPVTGQRQTATMTGTVASTSLYVYDPMTGNPLLVLNGSGAVTERDLPGRTLGQTMAVESGMTGSGAGTVNWLLTDQVGTVTDVVSNFGTVVDHVVRDSFGNFVGQTNASAGVRFGFAGMVSDAVTGLNYDNARYYDSASGNFVTQDPLRFGGGDYDLYRYAANQPTDASDPTGQYPQGFQGPRPLGDGASGDDGRDMKQYEAEQQLLNNPPPPQPYTDVSIPDPSSVNTLAVAEIYKNLMWARHFNWHYGYIGNSTDPCKTMDPTLKKGVEDVLYQQYQAWIKRIQELSTGNSKLQQYLNEHPDAKYGRPPGQWLTRPHDDPIPAIHDKITIDRPLNIALADVAIAASTGKPSTDSSKITIVDPSDGYKGMNRSRPGTPKTPIDPNRCKNGSTADGMEGGAALIQVVGAAFQEATDGVSQIEVTTWEQNGQKGYYVHGLSDDDGRTVIRRWVGVDR